MNDQRPHRQDRSSFLKPISHAQEHAFASLSALSASNEVPRKPVDLDEAGLVQLEIIDEPAPGSEGLTGTAVAERIMGFVRPATQAAMAHAQRVVEAAMNLRDQIQAHDQVVEAELRARDAHVAQVIKDHGEFVTAANVEFEKAIESLGIIANNHLLDDGRPIPTSSDT